MTETLSSLVPPALGELTAADPVLRHGAIRRLYQLAPDGEDVQPWVVAALPFLMRIALDTGAADRGRILHLVGDLAGADRTWHMAGQTLLAKRALAAEPGLADLLADDDAAVREAAAYTLRAVARLLPGLTETLREQFTVETDATVRVTLLKTSVIAGSTGSDHEVTKLWLAEVADTDEDLYVRITALTEMTALFNPPPFDAGRARETLLGAYRAGLNREQAPIDDTVAPLLAGRRMAARKWTPGFHQVLSAVRATYRDDVHAHLGLLEQLLELDGRDARQDALYQARSVVQRLRGPYTALVRRTAELLHDRDPQVRAAALRLLVGIGEAARPAADSVHVALAHRSLWVTEGVQGPALGPAVQVLAELRDERALPILERLLDEAPHAHDLHFQISGYGSRARRLSRTLQRRLRGLHPEMFAEPWRYDAHRVALLNAVTAVAPQEAADYLAREPFTTTTLGLLARSGRASAGRAPEIRGFLTSDDPSTALAAARAIWHVAGDAESAAEVYHRFVDVPEHAVAAIDGFAELGISAAKHARRLSAARRRGADSEVVVAAANALWRMSGNPTAAWTLGRAWQEAPRTRPRIARLWAETGSGRYAARYVRAELATVTRHNANHHGMLPSEVTEDEQLLALCRELTATTRA
ncbi:hypothetical protein [Actinoplanes sp. NPDC051851]|uniref:hypothetical protein n=1 Tax=Actinoplanes sp. NPDC051851 TaxID=3154753 RepID=UPI00341C139D